MNRKWKRLSIELLSYKNYIGNKKKYEMIDNSYKSVLSMFVKQSFISDHLTADFNGTG